MPGSCAPAAPGCRVAGSGREPAPLVRGRHQIMSRISLVIFALAVAGLMAFGASQASASHVSCGDVITEDTTLDSDLDCGDLSGGAPPALTIGADGVTLDLNGHTISTACETDCAGTVVVDDSGGGGRAGVPRRADPPR